MILTIYTLLHVAISLVGIASGFVFFYGLLTGREFSRWTTLFLTTTVLTSVTGFFFPFRGMTPAIIFGIVSMVVLAIAIYAKYARQLAGKWRKTYVATTVFALYLNVFVLVVQSFLKIPVLKNLAPTQNDPPFQIAQLVVLVAFIVAGTLAAIRFRPQPAPALAKSSD